MTRAEFEKRVLDRLRVDFEAELAASDAELAVELAADQMRSPPPERQRQVSDDETRARADSYMRDNWPWLSPARRERHNARRQAWGLPPIPPPAVDLYDAKPKPPQIRSVDQIEPEACKEVAETSRRPPFMNPHEDAFQMLLGEAKQQALDGDLKPLQRLVGAQMGDPDFKHWVAVPHRPKHARQDYQHARGALFLQSLQHDYVKRVRAAIEAETGRKQGTIEGLGEVADLVAEIAAKNKNLFSSPEEVRKLVKDGNPIFDVTADEAGPALIDRHKKRPKHKPKRPAAKTHVGTSAKNLSGG